METGTLAEILDAAGHPTRLEALRALASNEEGLAAGELARRLRVVPNTLSPHLRKLAAARLVLTVRSGTTIIYRINRSVLGEAAAQLGAL